MPIEKLRPSFSFDEERIKQLKQIAPEAFADNQVNWEVLKEALGNYLEEDDVDVEHFGLFWPGKREARRMASIPSKGTLIPCPGEGIDEENTRNIFIEGENLEVLKILQKSYAGRIKMIYIDPPYNTGNDFVYDDNFTEPLEEYLRRTRQIDEEGKPLTTNKKSDGRFHSKWLSMMYPRLRLAWNLLSDEGVIFISIDDNEVHNLRQLLNETFGEENFIAQIIVQSNKRGQTYKDIAKTHEYLICYTKNIDVKLNELQKENNDLNLSDDIGNFNLRELRNRNPKFGRFNRPNLFYPIYADPNDIDANGLCSVSLNSKSKSSVEILPFNSKGEESCWRWGKTLTLKNIDKEVSKSNVVAKQRRDGGWNVFEKYRKGTYKAKSIWDETEVINEQGTLDLKNLGLKDYFDFPKPVELIKKSILLGSDKDDIILDFFAGSATTAQALLESNLSDNSNRKFICIQIDEETPTDSSAKLAHFEKITDISKQRIRLTIQKIEKELAKRKSKGNLDVDLGFRVFHLNKSNYLAWSEYKGSNLKDLEDLFSSQESSLINDWKSENLLNEILLMEGFLLDSKIEIIKDYKKNKVKQVISDFCEHKLLICLDKKVHSETIKNLQLGDTDIFICLDTAITDQEKVTLADKGLIKTI